MLTPEETGILRRHGLAVFRGKLLFNARPPITDDEIVQVEKRLTGPIPDGLLALWRVAFGGELDYDWSVALGDHQHSGSFCELFWPGSNAYHGLWGWMDHELELAQDVGEEDGVVAPERLDVIPFGGFEYLERLYVRVAPEHAGRVVLWVQGLPPAWYLYLHHDTVRTVANDVSELFDQLTLHVDATRRYGRASCGRLERPGGAHRRERDARGTRRETRRERSVGVEHDAGGVPPPRPAASGARGPSARLRPVRRAACGGKNFAERGSTPLRSFCRWVFLVS